MRRFIAYLLASLTIFLGIGIAFKPVATSINADLDFRDGREITFRLSEREGGEKIDEDGESAKYYADVIQSRLISYGIDNYTIVTSGNDTVKVTLTTSSEKECEEVSKLLCTNPKIEICNLPKEDPDPEKAVSEIHVIDTDKFSWHDSKAYLTFNGASTVLIMPIPSEAQKTTEEMFEAAKKYEGGEDPKSNDDPEPPKQSIVLWMDREEDDEYADKDKNPNIAKKIIYDQFNTSNFYSGDKKDAFQIAFTPTGSDITSIRDSYNQARLMMNLLNASETLFKCEAIQTVIVPATVENLLIYGSQVNIAMSATFISLIVAFVVISLLLALFYRLGAVAAISTMAAHTFLTFLIFTLFRPAFNISAMVGLIVVALSALVTSIAHNNYLKEELYKGRNLKKANYEASKKTTLLTVDITILTAITGIVLYFLGGASVSSAGVVLVIGSVLNILINTFLLKGMMWLVTNNTNFQDRKHYSLFNVDEKKVPDLSKEEKPTYFGPFTDKDYTKKKKISGPIIATLLLASVAGLIAFSVTGRVFNTSNYYASTNEAMFSIRADEAGKPHPSIKDVADRLKMIKVNDTSTPLDIGDITYFEYRVIKDEGAKDNPEIYYYQTFKVVINEKDITSPIFTFSEEANAGDNLDDAIEQAMALYNVEIGTVRTFSNVVYNVPNNVGVVAASTVISLVVFSIYLLIRRFRASRVLSVFITSGVGATLTLGFISLTRVVATPVLSVSMVLTMLLTTLMTLFILHKDKELIKEERLRDLATRKAVLTKANAMALLPMLIFALISVYAAINFFGFGHKEFLALFFSSAFGLVAGVALLLTWFLPMCNFFDEQFSRVKLPQIRRNKKNKVKEKSNAPEEAIFIGIND